MPRKFIDISSNNHPGGAPIDWPTVKASGVEGVFVKLTEGTWYVNGYALADCSGALGAGLEVDAYHFARPDVCHPADEARFFHTHLMSVGGLHRVALDLEVGASLGWDDLVNYGQGFISSTPVDDLYVNWYYLHGLESTGRGLLVKVWEALPGATSIPPGVDAVQYGQEAVPGIEGPVDVNLVSWPAPTGGTAAVVTAVGVIDKVLDANVMFANSPGRAQLRDEIVYSLGLAGFDLSDRPPA